MTARPREPYPRHDAKDWAQEAFRGVANVIIPSFRSDLRGLNEAGIRHDVRRNIDLGFWGALLVSEAGTTPAEMREFMEIACDEAAGRHFLVLHGVFDSAEDVIEQSRFAKSIGIDAVLLGFPNSFRPRSRDELAAWLRHVCDNVDLGVILFAAWHWNLGHLDPSGFPLEVFVDLAALPNVIGVKYEVGHPGEVAIYQCFEAFRDKKVFVSDAQEINLPMWHDLFDVRWIGTNNFEYYGDRIPRVLDLLTVGRRDDALDLYWATHPARVTRQAVQSSYGGANFVHRYLWKYQAWLNGYNGGPLRQPAMKISSAQAEQVRGGLERSGIECHGGDLADFFEGRCPA